MLAVFREKLKKARLCAELFVADGNDRWPAEDASVAAIFSARNPSHRGGPCGHRLEALYNVAVTAGLRQGELLGLRWEDMDLEAGKLQVRRTFSEARSGRIFEAPKGGKGRWIRLTRKATEVLRAHRRAQLEERMRLAGLWQDQGLVFPSQVGTPLSARNLQRHFKSLLERASLPKSFRFHDLRHTCATLLLRQGVNPKFVQELLGHADVTLTLNVYSHVLPDMGDAAAGAMGDVLG
jgi:integrase